MCDFSLIVAVDEEFGIGKKGALPWNITSEMQYFTKITETTKDKKKKNAVIMGRKCWESIPLRNRPLSNRLNIILTRNIKQFKDKYNVDDNNVEVKESLESGLEILSSEKYVNEIEEVYVIGGRQIYEYAIKLSECKVIYLTLINNIYECDVFFPKDYLKNNYVMWSNEKPIIDKKSNIRYTKMIYVKNNGLAEYIKLSKDILIKHKEYEYLKVVEDIIENGNVRIDRTGTGTSSKFGIRMEYDLRHSFPLFTTKKVFWKGIVGELLWFISGSTNSKKLSEQNINIWNDNSSREFLDKVGLKDNEEGDLGPIYGFQWRHIGAEYKDMHTEYKGQGIDQLKEVINKIKNNPNDRRIILSAWNPIDLDKMALPPCHIFCQFYVAYGELSCQMYQRSGDMGLGVPFNIASYSLLTYMIAHICHLKPGDYIHVIGDAHIYNDHIEPLKKQLKNTPYPFPVLKIKRNVSDIDDFKYDDFILENYKSHEMIKMHLSV